MLGAFWAEEACKAMVSQDKDRGGLGSKPHSNHRRPP